MNDQSQAQPPDSRKTERPSDLEYKVDGFLSKYLLVWIWSVLFGASTGLFYSFIAYRSSESWGPLDLLLLVLVIFGLFATVSSNLALFRFLTVFLIPKFLPSDKRSDTEDYQLNHLSGRLLKNAFFYMIVGAVIRVSMVLGELVFSSLRRF